MSISNTKCETDFDFKTEGSTWYNKLSEAANSTNYRDLSDEEYRIAMEKEAERLYQEMLALTQK